MASALDPSVGAERNLGYHVTFDIYARQNITYRDCTSSNFCLTKNFYSCANDKSVISVSGLAFASVALKKCTQKQENISEIPIIITVYRTDNDPILIFFSVACKQICRQYIEKKNRYKRTNISRTCHSQRYFHWCPCSFFRYIDERFFSNEKFHIAMSSQVNSNYH